MTVQNSLFYVFLMSKNFENSFMTDKNRRPVMSIIHSWLIQSLTAVYKYCVRTSYTVILINILTDCHKLTATVHDARTRSYLPVYGDWVRSPLTIDMCRSNYTQRFVYDGATLSRVMHLSVFWFPIYRHPSFSTTCLKC